jgi:hypothetical protein
MARYLIQNSAAGTTAAPVKVTTGTSIKTMLQVKPSATNGIHVVEWGISFDGSAAATPGNVELMESDVAATVTALAAADITKLDGAALMGGDPTTNLIRGRYERNRIYFHRRGHDDRFTFVRLATDRADKSVCEAVPPGRTAACPDFQVLARSGDVCGGDQLRVLRYR